VVEGKAVRRHRIEIHGFNPGHQRLELSIDNPQIRVSIL
jgi:hypothetical protein